MRSRPSSNPLTLLALLPALVLGCRGLAAPEPTRAPTVETLAWMSGAWATDDASPRVEEHWTHPAGGTLLGTGRTIVAGRTVFFEFLRIETRASGLVLVAQPNGAAGTEFALVEADSEHAVFANPAHDFPKFIRYRRVGADELAAQVDDGPNGAGKAEEFRYRRRPGP